MASSQEVREAISTIREEQGDYGKPKQRIHKDGLQIVNALRGALEHPCCGKCDWLSIDGVRKGPRESVRLICAKDHSPLNLWINWYPDENPITCPDCTDPRGRPSAEVVDGE